MEIITDKSELTHFLEKTPLERSIIKYRRELNMNDATAWILQQEISDARKVQLCLRVQSIGRFLPSQCSVYAVIVNDAKYEDCISQRDEQLNAVDAGLEQMWQAVEEEHAKLPSQEQTEIDIEEWVPSEGEIQDMM